MKTWKIIIFYIGWMSVFISITAFILFKQNKIKEVEEVKKLEIELELDRKALEQSDKGITDKINIGDFVETNRLYKILFGDKKITGVVVKSLGYPSTDGYERVELDNGKQFTTKYLQLREGI